MANFQGALSGYMVCIHGISKSNLKGCEFGGKKSQLFAISLPLIPFHNYEYFFNSRIIFFITKILSLTQHEIKKIN